MLFTLAAPAAKADDAAMDFYGIHTALHRYNDYEASIDEIIASGVKWIHLGADWGSLQTAPGAGPDYNPSKWNMTDVMKFDAIVNRLSASGVSMVWTLGFTAPWASSMPGSPNATRYPPAPANWSDWNAFVSVITNRYKGKIKHWEVWNEPDLSGFWLGSVAQYHELLMRASQEIRATDASNKSLVAAHRRPRRPRRARGRQTQVREDASALRGTAKLAGGGPACSEAAGTAVWLGARA